MAGTLQTLIFAPQPAKMPSFRHRNLHFSSNCSVLLSRSVTFKLGRSISRPIRASQPSDQVSGSPKGFNWAKPLSKFAADNFLPLALIGGVTLGLANPSLGCLADRYHLSKVSTFVIFIISGLTLRSGEIGAAAEAWPVGIFGLCSILLFTPYFSKLILQVHLQPQEFVTGLAMFSCMPTTLSSGVALTLLAGGNSALALAMTVISNLLGILIVPFSISRFIASGVGVSVPTDQLFRSLVLTLLIPLIMGKVLRESFRGLAEFVDQNRKLFSKISAIFLSLVPWIQVSRSRSLLLMVKPAVFLVAIGMGISMVISSYYENGKNPLLHLRTKNLASLMIMLLLWLADDSVNSNQITGCSGVELILLHLILLAFNATAVRSLSAVSGGSQSVFAKKENARAVLLVASQKTLPVMVAVVEQLGGAFGESGLLVLPCVAAHLIQIIMDSFLVNFWPREDLSSNNVKVA